MLITLIFTKSFHGYPLENITSTKNDPKPVETVKDSAKTVEKTAPVNNGVSYEDYKKFDSIKFKKAKKYFFEKKFEMAELLLQEELKDNPENYIAYSYLGDIFLTKGHYDASISLYKKAVDLNPDIAENSFRLGQAYYYKNLGNLAIENYEKAYNMNPNLKYTYYHIGLTHLTINRDKKKTIEYWEKYLSMAPEDPQYEKILRVVQLLKSPNFKIPPVGSDIPLEESLHLGGEVLTTKQRTDEDDKSEGHTEKEIYKPDHEIDRDDDLK